MAESDKIKSSDIIQKDLFKNTIKSAEDLIDVLKALEDQTKKNLDATSSLLKTQGKKIESAEDIQKVNDALKEGFTERTKLSKIEQERIKLEQKLKTINSDSIQQNEELKILIQEQTKTNKELAKEKLGLVSAYEKESKKLNELRKRYKDLAVEQKQNTKEGKALLKQIRTLDKELKDIDASVGQFQRSVGDYNKQALGASKNSLAWAAALIGLNSEMGNFNNVLGANEEAGEEVRKTQGSVNAIVNELQNRAVKAGKSILNLIKIYTNWDSKNISAYYTLEDLSDSVDNLKEDLNEIGKTTNDAIANQIAWEKELRLLNEELASVNGQLEKQNAIAGDSTRTFSEQEEAIRKVQDIQVKRAEILESIAQREIDLINQNIASRSKLSLEEVKALSTAELAAKTDKNISYLLNQRSEATIKLIDAQSELATAEIENAKVLKEVQRDRFERELDFAIDAFDVQKTVNERRIADDRKTIEEREAILNETVRLADKSFQSQKDLFSEFVDDRVDFDALVAETDEEAIRRTLLKLNLDDVELGRALEVIKERKIAIQDLEDAEKDIFDAKVERFQKDKDAQDRAKINNLETQLELAKGLQEQFS